MRDTAPAGRDCIMKRKTLLCGLLSGLLLAACGGAASDAGSLAEAFDPLPGPLCEGWDAGARRCAWKCTSGAPQWSAVGAGVVASGQCQDFATARCGASAYASCWSR